jgi:hypothetical protein
MHTMILLALMQGPSDSAQFTSIYEKPFNDTLNLSMTVAREQNDSRRLRVSLIDRRGPGRARLITEVRDTHVVGYRVLRADDSSVVVSRLGDYFAKESLKLFLHPRTKALLKRIDYSPDIGLTAVDSSEVARVLEVPANIVQQLENKPWDIHSDTTRLPKEIREHPIPRSTYAEFARARPERVRQGYSEDLAELGEDPGPYQVVGSRIWLGKTFYDGEGWSGVGGFGYFDTKTSRYTWLDIPELADWSVSALLIEEDAAWIGLIWYPEAEPFGGGLLRYDFKSGTSQKLPTEEVIYQIVRWKDRVYVGTKNGAYQVQGATLTKHYAVEPNIDGRFILVTENPSWQSAPR